MDLLQLFEEAWRQNGEQGISPCSLMKSEWTNKSDDKDEFYQAVAMTLITPGASEPALVHVVVVPMVIGWDDRGRPDVSGVARR